MPTYRAPVDEVMFLLRDVFHVERYNNLPGFAEATPDVIEAVLTEAAKFCEDVLTPLNRVGDKEGCRRHADGSVTTPPGFRDAYKKLVAGGWVGASAPAEFGGQGLPTVLTQAIREFLYSSNMAFAMYSSLALGAVAAIYSHGSAEQKARYLPKLISGEWAGTMNLTEPQCGTDLGQLRCRASPQPDGSYRITGTKIFISAGEHDLAENIIHLVLARIDGAPAGVKGISLFIVPKFLVRPDGSTGERNDVQCVSIEHKLGIRASPTCAMVYGQRDGAVGYLLGEANHGLEYMFIMMNAARLSVGLEGYAVAERAYQGALDWARNRVQGRPADQTTAKPLSIVHHGDVRRMLLTMKSQIEAMRYLALYAASQLDRGAHHEDAAVRKACKARGEFLIPIVKGWCTETGLEIASLGIQVHGGMGFIEETGAAQAMRDVRISTIYEGTTGIQAQDLIGRKLAKDSGAAFMALAADISAELAGYASTAGG